MTDVRKGEERGLEGGKIKEDKKGFNQVERSEGKGEVVDEGPGLTEEKRLTRERGRRRGVI